MNYSNSIFCYATSELSQDAFICWLCSFLKEENKGVDIVLERCASEFVRNFIPNFTSSDCIECIETQHKISYEISAEKGKTREIKGLIDVLLAINGKKVIIEDKTFTSCRDNQINTYKVGLINEGIREGDIICVYYKIFDQCYKEESADYEFTRDSLLELFVKYENQTDNPIFIGYLERLRHIDDAVNRYKILPIEEWEGSAFVGFYRELCKTKLATAGFWWNYVNNPSGGFWGLCWSGIGKQTLEKTSLPEDFLEVYPQFEERILAIKLKIAKKDNKDVIKDGYYRIQGYAERYLGEWFRKKKYHYGEYMTIAYVDYDKDNVNEKIELVNSFIQGIKEEFGL